MHNVSDEIRYLSTNGYVDDIATFLPSSGMQEVANGHAQSTKY